MRLNYFFSNGIVEREHDHPNILRLQLPHGFAEGQPLIVNGRDAWTEKRNGKTAMHDDLGVIGGMIHHNTPALGCGDENIPKLVAPNPMNFLFPGAPAIK